MTAPVIRGGVATIHPDFDFDSRRHDVAVVTYSTPVFAGVTPVELPRAGLVDRLPKRQTLRLVGYGADPERGDEAAVLVFEGYRQTRLTSVKRVTPRQIEFKGGLCSGDSGAPQFLAETNTVLALFSDGGDFNTCPGPFLSQRLDTRSERRFLAEFVRLS